MLGISLYVTHILASLQLSNFFSFSLNIENIVMLCKNRNVNKLLLLLLLLLLLWGIKLCTLYAYLGMII